ncbi:reverse transcriptase domain-containing protein [Tanacetum coccineum]
MSEFNNREFSQDSRIEFRATYKTLLTKEIEGPETLEFVDFGTMHEGLALQNLDQFCHVSIRHGNRNFTSFKFRDNVAELDIIDTMVFQLGGFKRSMTIRQFNLALGLYTDEEMNKNLFGIFCDACRPEISYSTELGDPSLSTFRSSRSKCIPSPLRDPESLIRRMNLGEPSSLFDFEEVMSIPYNNQGLPPAGPPPPNNNGPPPVARPNGPAPRSMEELFQPSINGRGGPIAPIPIQATDFGLHHHMIQQVQNTCQFHGLPSDDANRHIDKFLEITQHMKQNGVSDDALRLSFFPYSLTDHAIAWYDRLPRTSIHSFDDMMRKFLSKYFPPSLVTKLRNEITKFEQKPHESLFEASIKTPSMLQREELLCKRHRKNELIENMTAHHNHWDTSATRDETSRNISSTTTESPEVVRQLEMMNKNFLDMMRQMQSVKFVSPKCETCGGPHSFTECLDVDDYTQEAAYAATHNHNSGG